MNEIAVTSLCLCSGQVVSHNKLIQDIQRERKVNQEWFLYGTLAGDILTGHADNDRWYGGCIKYCLSCLSH